MKITGSFVCGDNGQSLFEFERTFETDLTGRGLEEKAWRKLNWLCRAFGWTGTVREFCSGALLCEFHYLAGKYNDTDDGTPAQQQWYRNGSKMAVYHKIEDLFHDPDDDTPAYTEWSQSGIVLRERLSCHGDLRDLNGVAAARGWWDEGNQKHEAHMMDGKLFDPSFDVPAQRDWFRNGFVERQVDYRNCELQDHDSDMPTVTTWHLNGSIESKSHFKEGALCDAPGGEPAYQTWGKDGKLITEERHDGSRRSSTRPISGRLHPESCPEKFIPKPPAMIPWGG